jgi:hypothetical protein
MLAIILCAVSRMTEAFVLLLLTGWCNTIVAWPLCNVWQDVAVSMLCEGNSVQFSECWSCCPLSVGLSRVKITCSCLQYILQSIVAKWLLHTDIPKTEKFNGVFKSCIRDFELQSYNRWLVSAYSPSTVLIKSLQRTVEKKITLWLNSLKIASVQAKMCQEWKSVCDSVYMVQCAKVG